eukprot:6269490-Amphidinium_carterae.2
MLTRDKSPAHEWWSGISAGLAEFKSRCELAIAPRCVAAPHDLGCSSLIFCSPVTVSLACASWIARISSLYCESRRLGPGSNPPHSILPTLHRWVAGFQPGQPLAGALRKRVEVVPDTQGTSPCSWTWIEQGGCINAFVGQTATASPEHRSIRVPILVGTCTRYPNRCTRSMLAFPLVMWRFYLAG